MAYLLSSEYVQFGLSADTADAWVSAASAMIDAYCRRASLMVTSYTERLRVSRRGSVQLTYGPIQAVSAVTARYSAASNCCGAFSWGQADAGYAGASLPELGCILGLPGQWVAVDASSVFLDMASGELQLPCNAWQMLYSEAEVTYTAGAATVPNTIKSAVAQIVKNAQSTPGLNVRASKVDLIQTQYFSDSLMDSQVKAMLRPFVAERLG